MFPFFFGGGGSSSLPFFKWRLFMRWYTEQIIHEGKYWVRDILNNRLTQRSRRFLLKIILCTQLLFSGTNHIEDCVKKVKWKFDKKLIWSVDTSHLPWPALFYLDLLAQWMKTGWHIFSFMNHSSVEFFLYDKNSWQRPVIYGPLSV